MSLQLLVRLNKNHQFFFQISYFFLQARPEHLGVFYLSIQLLVLVDKVALLLGCMLYFISTLRCLQLNEALLFLEGLHLLAELFVFYHKLPNFELDLVSSLDFLRLQLIQLSQFKSNLVFVLILSVFYFLFNRVKLVIKFLNLVFLLQNCGL